MTKYNLNQIVSIGYHSEVISTDYQLEHYRSFVEWILIKPKRLVIRYNSLVGSEILEVKNLPIKYFIRDNKVWIKPRLSFRFSDGSFRESYFSTNEEAMMTKERIYSDKFVSL